MTLITCDISGNGKVIDDDGVCPENRDIAGAIGQDASKEQSAYVGEVRAILRAEPGT